MASRFVKRQEIPDGWVIEDGVAMPWWYSTSGQIFKWCLFLIPLALILLWFVIGRIHVSRRIKKGLPPLRYHRCLVPRRYRPQPNPWPQQRAYHPADGYYMQNMPPPPVYDPTRLPQYEGPPPVGSKVDPDQTVGVAGPVPQYQPPPGPPPAVLR